MRKFQRSQPILIEQGPANQSGRVQIGDRLLSVDGTPVKGRLLDEITPLFLGAAGTPVFLSLDTGTMVRTVQVTRAPVEVPLDSSNDCSPPPRALDNPFRLNEFSPVPPAPDNPFRSSPPQPPTHNFSHLYTDLEGRGNSVREMRDLLIRDHPPHGNEDGMGPRMSMNSMPFDMRMEHRLGMEQKFLNSFSPDTIVSKPTSNGMLNQGHADRPNFVMNALQASSPRRIALLTHGWQHDIEPFEQMAQALADRGHVVYIAAPERYMPKFQQAAADWFIPLEHDPSAAGQGHAREKMQLAVDELHFETLRE